MSGKGSRPRPIPNQDKFENNWDKIFGSKNKDKSPPDSSKDKTKGK